MEASRTSLGRTWKAEFPFVLIRPGAGTMHVYTAFDWGPGSRHVHATFDQGPGSMHIYTAFDQGPGSRHVYTAFAWALILGHSP